MKTILKTFSILLICICLILILFIASVLLVPRLINTTSLGSKVRNEVSSRINGNFDFSTIDVTFFPRPHIFLYNPQIQIPGKLSATAEIIEAYPNLSKLLTGHLAFKKASGIQPVITYWLPNPDTAKKKSQSTASVSKILPSLLETFFHAIEPFPLIDYATINKGKIILMQNNDEAVTLHNIEMEMENPGDQISLKVKAASNMFNTFSFDGKLQTSQYNGNAKAEIIGADLAAFSNTFFPYKSFTIAKANTNININLKLANRTKLKSEFTCSVPVVSLKLSGKTTDIRIDKLSGSLDVTPSFSTISISELNVLDPSTLISGSIRMSDKTPKYLLNVFDTSIDIGSTRRTALDLAGSKNVTQAVFNILQSGTIASLQLSSQSNTLKDLVNPNNLVLEAHLQESKVFIPGANLMVTDAAGTVGMREGILAGSDIQARWQNSTAQKGSFTIQLFRNPLPLNVSATINTDAADVPKILAKYIKGDSFNANMEKINNLQGTATTRLSLTGDTEKLKVSVTASAIDVSANHTQIPFPISITHGNIRFEDDTVKWDHVNGDLATSSFSNISGNFDLNESQTMTLSTGTSRIVLPDLLDWISSNNAIQKYTDYYGGGKTVLQLSEITAHGPLQDLGKTHFKVTGELEDLSIQHLPRQPDPLDISSLKFTLDQEDIIIHDIKFNMLDSTIAASGKYQGYSATGAGSKQNIKASFDGRIGPKTTSWLSEIPAMPTWLKLRPLTFRKSNITYLKARKHTISADLALQDDLRVIADIILSPESFIIKKLTLKDHLSDVSFTTAKSNNHIDVSFSGALHEPTIDKIFEVHPPKKGFIKGDATFSVNQKDPINLHLDGELTGDQLSVPIDQNEPLQISSIKISGIKDTIAITSNNISWLGSALSASGKLSNATTENILINLDIEADDINAGAIIKKLKSNNLSNNQKRPPYFSSTPLAGLINLNINKLKMDDFAIEPLQAVVSYQNKTADIRLQKTKICGVKVPGTVSLSSPDITFQLQPEAQDQMLDTTLNCFLKNHFTADGTLQLTGTLAGHGTTSNLIDSTTGDLEISISNGHIYKNVILLNILKFLNITQILDRRVSSEEMEHEGIGFSRMQTHLRLKSGILEYSNFILDADEIKITGKGEINLKTKKIKFTLLVSPLATIASIEGKIPLFGEMLQTITAIPLSLSGKIGNIHVLPLSPASIGHELRLFSKQAFGFPLKLVHLTDFQKINR